MRKILLFIVIILGISSTAIAVDDTLTSIIASMNVDQHNFRWDKKTFIKGDFNGDGKIDFAIIGKKNKAIVLALRVSSKVEKTYRNTYLNFNVSPSEHAAICELPAKLTVVKQICDPMSDGSLPGCKPSKIANSLILSGGDCDSINLYWNHESNSMDWWRL